MNIFSNKAKLAIVMGLIVLTLSPSCYAAGDD